MLQTYVVQSMQGSSDAMLKPDSAAELFLADAYTALAAAVQVRTQQHALLYHWCC